MVLIYKTSISEPNPAHFSPPAFLRNLGLGVCGDVALGISIGL